MEANYFMIMWWLLPYIDMNQTWVYMCPPSWTPLCECFKMWVLVMVIFSIDIVLTFIMENFEHAHKFVWKILIYLPLEFSTINTGQSWPRLTLIQPSSFKWFWTYLRNYITSSVNISMCNFKNDNPLLLFSCPGVSDS